MFRHPYPKCEALQQVFRHLYPKCGALMIRRDLGPSVFLRGNKEMTARFDNLGFYNVDTRYLQYLNTIEPEVQFTQEKDYTQNLSANHSMPQGMKSTARSHLWQ